MKPPLFSGYILYILGSYFARDAKYSHSYTDDSDVQSMFISRVLVGDFTKGSSDYRRPPSKDGRGANLYDSCVDDVTNPSIYVVFERQHIYPEYLLQYKTSGLKTVQPPIATNPYYPSFVRSTSAQSNTASNQPSNLSYNFNSATFQYPLWKSHFQHV